MKSANANANKANNKKKFIPIAVVAVAVLLILAFIFIGRIVEKYTPSKERMDLSKYYGTSGDSDVAIVLDNEVLDAHARLIDGTVYLDYATLHDRLNDRFFWDSNENRLLYATSGDLISADVESNNYYVTKDSHTLDHIVAKVDSATVYVAIDFASLYTNISYQVFEDPGRVVIRSDWSEYDVANAKRGTSLRVKGGIKSPILADVEKGQKLTVLEQGEDWTKVSTNDGIVGYVKSRALGDLAHEIPESSFEPEVFSHIKKDFKICMAWHQVTSMEANGKVSELLSHSKGVNVISPTWFYLKDEEGGIGSLASSDYVNYCHQNGVEVWALVSNFGAKDQGMEPPDTAAVLTRSSRREALVNNLVSAAIQYNLDGINLDFESLDPSIGDAYIQFVRELSIKCGNNGIVLSVDNYAPTEYTAFYDREEQSVFADYVILMGYDEHYAGSEEAGSVASIGFVRDGVANTLKEVPTEQVILGMPFYTRIWSETPVDAPADETATGGNPADAENPAGGENPADAENQDAASSEAVETDVDIIDTKLESRSSGMQEAQNLLQANGVTPTWSEEAGQNYAEYVKDGVTYRIWLEDATSLEEKLKVLSENSLAGGAFWKIGLETSDVWDTIIKYLN